ncbi:malate dehydrogenase [Aliarcobacter lanthieri]|uniref:malate dehydrogenase n=1 Tax=Aliarcobacter lanthieri TaxID=1355374 RepID=UPI00047B2294|nr:malate dehydrogenase [Aliarcobacter lanthieri]
MNKKVIGIVGVGNVGSNLAFNIATNNLCDEVLLKDIREEFTEAMALDITQASLSSNNKTIVKACNNKEFKNCNIIVITAGIARKPNMSREDLLFTNAKIMNSILDDILPLNPNAIFIIVSNPLDAMVYSALKKSNLSRNKVFGMAGVLDSARFKYYISKKINFYYKKIDAIVIGSHSNSMVPLISQARIDDKRVIDILNKEDIQEILENTKNGGAKIVELLKTGSAYFAPSFSTYLMCKSILNDEKNIFSCSVKLEGEYGYNDIPLGTPVVLGKEGIEKIIELDLNKKEKEELNKSIETIQSSINILK